MESKGNNNVVIKKVRVRDLKPHRFAQRLAEQPWVEYLKANLDLHQIGIMHVVRQASEGDVYLIVDGQHRWLALQQTGHGDLMVQVAVHLDAVTKEQACQLFLDLNRTRRIAPFSKFRAQVRAGQLDAMTIQSVVKRHGLEISNHSGDGLVHCVNALCKIYQLHGRDILGMALDVALGAWGKQADGLDGRLLVGMAILLATFPDKLDATALVKDLAGFKGGARGVIGLGRSYAESTRVPVSRGIASTLVNVYNRQRRTGKLPSLESLAK